MELKKITLVPWVNKTFDQSLTKHNIEFGFRVCKILPLNLKAMEVKTNPSNIYTTPTKNHSKEGEEDYNLNDGVDESQQQEQSSTIKLLNIFGIDLRIITTNNSTMSSTQFCCYVEMHDIPLFGLEKMGQGNWMNIVNFTKGS